MKQPQENIMVSIGNKFEVMCKAESASGRNVTYSWFKRNSDGYNEELQCYESKMTVPQATYSHNGYYFCNVSNKINSHMTFVQVMSLPLGEQLVMPAVTQDNTHFKLSSNSTEVVKSETTPAMSSK